MTSIAEEISEKMVEKVRASKFNLGNLIRPERVMIFKKYIQLGAILGLTQPEKVHLFVKNKLKSTPVPETGLISYYQNHARIQTAKLIELFTSDSLIDSIEGVHLIKISSVLIFFKLLMAEEILTHSEYHIILQMLLLSDEDLI